MQRRDQRAIQLQQGLAAGADDIRLAAAGPFARHNSGQAGGFGEFSAVCTIGTNKIRVAEFAHRLGAIFLKTTPQIATGKAQKYGGPASLRSFSLQGVENLFDAVGHAALNFA